MIIKKYDQVHWNISHHNKQDKMEIIDMFIYGHFKGSDVGIRVTLYLFDDII